LMFIHGYGCAMQDPHVDVALCFESNVPAIQCRLHLAFAYLSQA